MSASSRYHWRMTARVDLIWLGAAAEPPAWPFGAMYRAAANARAVHELIAARAARSTADAWLFWDSALAPPAPERALELLDRPGDVWHAGLALGSAGAPRIIDLHSAHMDLQPRRRRRAGGDELARVDPRLSRAHERAAVERAVTRIRFARRRRARMGPPMHHERRAAAPRAVAARRAPAPRDVTRSRSPTNSGSRARVSAPAGARGPRCAPRSSAMRASRTSRMRISCRARPGAPSRPLVPYVRPSAQRLAPRPAVTVLIPTLDRYEYLRTILSQLALADRAPPRGDRRGSNAAARRDTAARTGVPRSPASHDRRSSRQGSAPRGTPVSRGRAARRSCSWMTTTRSRRI